ncbi:MAG: hypothetical protein JRJ73_16485 [Deltaproteobacteria bacterium]|nr:hypothetical protein [Deltaproteobacteria bacterium]
MKPNLTTAETRFLGLLWVDHTGAANKISAENLAVMYTYALEGHTLSLDEARETVIAMKRIESPNRMLEQQKRIVRKMQSHLLMKHENTGVLSQAGIGGGYWIAENQEEIDKFFSSFRKRGMHGIVKASRASKTRFANIMQQLTFEFEDLVDKTGDVPAVIDSRSPAPYVVVDALLEKMMKNPEQFSEELRKLGAKFGSVLLPKAQYAQIKSHTQRLQELIAEMEA